MNETMNQEIKDELTRIEGMIQGNGNNGELRWWKFLQVICSISLVTIMPWGVWVTKKIYEMDTQQKLTLAWQDLGPRFTPDNAKSLRLEIKDEVRIELSTKLDRMATQLESVRDDVSEFKQELKAHMAVERSKP